MRPCWILPAAWATWSRDTTCIRWPCQLLLLVTLDRSPLDHKGHKEQANREVSKTLFETLDQNKYTKGFCDASNLQNYTNNNGYCSFAEIDVNRGSGRLWNSCDFMVFHRVWIYGEVIRLSSRGLFKFQSVVFSLHKDKNSWGTREQCAVETNKECCCKTCGNVISLVDVCEHCQLLTMITSYSVFCRQSIHQWKRSRWWSLRQDHSSFLQYTVSKLGNYYLRLLLAKLLKLQCLLELKIKTYK